ncbi:ABC transporter permease subunit [Agromyces aurantiacus]|uniref:ABC transporter permease subunit n=1 Tax=Agromyces aurantiacus TaxID=165814 RepID=A0ABV9R861_9MICO|nr:ABC transporter permease subunit [Agromyces aurantiacus]MBM7504448.1 ABC-2 type transport system permease protein [Agromyces aurantiacus]
MNPPLPLFRRSIVDGWRGLLGWTVGLLAALFLYLPLYPTFGGQSQMQDLLDSLPQELIKSLNYDQIATGSGYTQATYFGLIGFILGTIAAVGWGTGAIANDEENGQLELTLAHGVIRGQVFAERAAAVFVKILWLALVSAVVILGLDGPAELGIDPGPLVAVTVAYVGLIGLSAAAAIAVGGITGRRSWALGAGAGVAVYGYALNALGNQSADLEWLHDWSPYSWAYADSPLQQGWTGMLWLNLAVAAALLVVGWLVFRRRDIAV